MWTEQTTAHTNDRYGHHTYVTADLPEHLGQIKVWWRTDAPDVVYLEIDSEPNAATYDSLEEAQDAAREWIEALIDQLRLYLSCK